MLSSRPTLRTPRITPVAEQPAPAVPEVSVVVPAHNEAPSLPELIERIGQALNTDDRSFEIIVVDDGSTDESRRLLEALQVTNPHLRLRYLDRRRGKSFALDCGLQAARGETVVFMDADLQDVPEEVPMLLQTLDGGAFDLVQGWRSQRADAQAKRLASRAFNSMCSNLSGLHLHDHNCGLKVFRRAALTDVRLSEGAHRFFPLLAARAGLRVGEVRVHHAARAFGRSRYGWGRYFAGLRDLVRIALFPRLVQMLPPVSTRQETGHP